MGQFNLSKISNVAYINVGGKFYKKNMRQLLGLITVLISFTCAGQGIGKLSKQDVKKIDNLFQDFGKKDSPGYAIGISKGTETLYLKGFGSANLDYSIPITTNSSFDIASVSKQFTSACIALLIMDGKLSLETPIAEYVPELNKYTDTIRVKHLIYNTSGKVTSGTIAT